MNNGKSYLLSQMHAPESDLPTEGAYLAGRYMNDMKEASYSMGYKCIVCEKEVLFTKNELNGFVKTLCDPCKTERYERFNTFLENFVTTPK